MATASRKEPSLANILILAQWDTLWTSGLQSCKIIHLSCLSYKLVVISCRGCRKLHIFPIPRSSMPFALTTLPFVRRLNQWERLDLGWLCWLPVRSRTESKHFKILSDFITILMHNNLRSLVLHFTDHHRLVISLFSSSINIWVSFECVLCILSPWIFKIALKISHRLQAFRPRCELIRYLISQTWCTPTSCCPQPGG